MVFDPNESEKLAAKGDKVILVRIETCPDDIHGIVPAQGVITSRGGMTSHAAVVRRGMGKPCVAGCEALRIDLQRGEMVVAGQTIKKGDVISIDGSTGEIFKGSMPTIENELSAQFKTLLDWADEKRGLKVRANADTPEDAKVAREFGAQGIGLCRTEHMFMAHGRLPHARNDHGGNAAREKNGTCKAIAYATRRLHRHIQGDERSACHHPAPGSAPS